MGERTLPRDHHTLPAKNPEPRHEQTSRQKLLFTASPTPDHREGALAVPWCPRRPPGTSGGAYRGGRK